MRRSRQAARASYDRMSRWYDLLAGSEEHFTEIGLQKLAVSAGECVLEVGFGTGHALLALARSAGSSGSVVGIDLSQGMIDVARDLIEKSDLPTQPVLVCADGVHPPFADGRFDALFVSFTLELFDTREIPVVLGEWVRLLRPGGRICVISLSKGAHVGSEMVVRLYERLHQAFPAAIDCRPIFVRRAIEGAGFCVDDVTETAMWGLPVEIVLARRPAAGG